VEQRSHRPIMIESTPVSAELAHERRRLFPAGASLTLAELEGFESGINAQRLLQETWPVTWFGQVQAWLVTSRPLVDEVLGGHERFSVHARASFVRSVLGDHMLSRDGEGHRQQRAPYDHPLRLRPVRENYSALIAELADSFLAQLHETSGAELRSTFANPLAITVSGRALGLAFDDIDEIGQAYDVFAARMVDYAGTVEDTARTRDALDAIIQRNLERIRLEPDSSIISSVLSSQNPSLRHSDEEIIGNVRIILFGAIETVTSIILSTTWALLTHTDQLAEVRADSRLFVAAVNEALRWIFSGRALGTVG
jgi:cytochrome P450